VLLCGLVWVDGGGGNRDGNFSICLGYGGDDDSEESKGNLHRNRRLLLFYTWWAAGVASMAVLVWALGCLVGFHGTPNSQSRSLWIAWCGLGWRGAW
jgi:hypothetical protein